MSAVSPPPLERDSDGDGLPDLWELRGYVHGGRFVDLPSLGADPWHKDLFVWMDYMVTPGGVNQGPSQTVIDNIKAVFNQAPVSNPDGTAGIHIHPLLMNQAPYKDSLGNATDEDQVWRDFDAIKENSLDPAYLPAFRYMIWAYAYDESTSSGLARNIPATDFIVSLGTWSATGGTDWEKLGTFIHELGHCLGLTHGGADHENYKPNYLSIMNYSFQTYGLYKGGKWGDQGYPLQYDYQRVNTPSLDKAALVEANGLNGADDLRGYGTFTYHEGNPVFVPEVADPIDWNQNSVIDASPVSADINAEGTASGILTAQNNWENINLDADGQIGPLAALARSRALARPMPPELRDEMDLKIKQILDAARLDAAR